MKVTIYHVPVFEIYDEWQFLVGREKTPSFTTESPTIRDRVKKLLKKCKVEVEEKEWMSKVREKEQKLGDSDT